MKNKVLGIIRHVLTFGGGYAVAKGWGSEAQITELTGALASIIGVLWSIFAPEKAEK